MAPVAGVLHGGVQALWKDKQGRQGWGVYARDQLECLGVDEDLTKSFWVRIKGRSGTGDAIV